VEIARIRVTPSVENHYENVPDTEIFGIPITYKDEKIKRLFYDTVLNRNEDARVPLDAVFNNSNIYCPIQADFTERVFNYKYFGKADILSEVGGISAFVYPILKNLTPYFVMFFLYSLANVLWYKYE